MTDQIQALWTSVQLNYHFLRIGYYQSSWLLSGNFCSIVNVFCYVLEKWCLKPFVIPSHFCLPALPSNLSYNFNKHRYTGILVLKIFPSGRTGFWPSLNHIERSTPTISALSKIVISLSNCVHICVRSKYFKRVQRIVKRSSILDAEWTFSVRVSVLTGNASIKWR